MNCNFLVNQLTNQHVLVLLVCLKLKSKNGIYRFMGSYVPHYFLALNNVLVSEL